jgi:transposase
MQTQSKQIDFSGQNFYCGIDTHKKSWAVTIETDEFALKTFTQNADPELLAKHLTKNYPGGSFFAGYEAGYFGYGIQRRLESMGINCIVIHPADIPTCHKDKDQKRDPRDSRKIARALKNREVNPIWIPSISVEQDRQLLRIREKLVRDKSRIKNRIKAILQLHGIQYPEIFSQAGSHWSARFIKWLESIQLKEISGTEALRSLVRCLQFQRSELLTVSRNIRILSRNERYYNSYLKLIRLSGIGTITAMTLLTEVGDISRFKTADNFRSFLGLIPRANDSGEKERPGRITKRANVHLRYLLIESTWMAIRYNPYYLHLYKNYKQRMKENKALVRTAGKLSNQIYFTLKQASEN